MAHIDTILVQASNGSDDQTTGAVSAPLYFSTAFRHPGLGSSTGFDYARLETPTRSLLEKQLALIEHGADCAAVSSGMAAIDLLFSSIMHSGENFVSSDDLYGGSFRYFDDIAKKNQVSYKLWDGKSEAALIDKIDDKTRILWLETPSNPTMKLIDIKKCAADAHKKNPNIIVAVDNTFLSPIFQNPIDDGADVVIHSATKYLGGHNDILAGAVICKDLKLGQLIDYNLVTRGQVLDPFSCWLLLRSLKTLHLRMARHDENGRFLAKKILQIKGVQKVLYPGLGGMLSFYLDDGYDTDKFLQGLKVFSFAESLGGAESLITIPSIQTHHDMSQLRRDQLGITDNLVRVSAGLEDKNDLLADLTQAITGACL